VITFAWASRYSRRIWAGCNAGCLSLKTLWGHLTRLLIGASEGRMAEKRTKGDRSQRQTEQLEKRVDRHPDEIEKKPPTLAPK
jgi:hypothetical protein